jgi:hypothetical protein
LNSVLTYAYSIFSHVLWPAYVPIAALLIEPVPWRRKVIGGIAVTGAGVGLYLLYNMIQFPITSQVEGGHILYASPHFYAVVTMALYVLGTCVSMMFSSQRTLVAFGIAALLSFVAAYVFYAVWLISVWCFFAAIMSLVVLLYFLGRERLGAGDYTPSSPVE